MTSAENQESGEFKLEKGPTDKAKKPDPGGFGIQETEKQKN